MCGEKMLIYLKPLSIFPELHSDTLFGAIVYAINELYPEITNDMISAFEDEPPFILSSTFPFIFNNNSDKDFKDTKKIKFFPKIIFPQSKDEENIKVNPKNYKEYKKVDFIEDSIFFKLNSGKLSESEILKDFKSYTRIKGLLLNKGTKINDNIQVSYGENIIPNNSINRITNETNDIFYTSGNEFKNIGLFFFVEFYDESYMPLVKGAIKFLRDRGFGKDISTGKGQFDYYIDDDYEIESEYEFNSDSKYNYFINLSRFIPNKEDLNHIDKNSNYEIGSKRGRSSSNEIRKQVRFFKEGSIFPQYEKYYGRIIKSGKINPAVEYGFAYPLKCINVNGGK